MDTFTGVKVESINFDSSPYLQSLPYSVSFAHYPSGGFQFAYGVSNPSSTWNYTENQNKTISIEHSVSAKGINRYSKDRLIELKVCSSNSCC